MMTCAIIDRLWAVVWNAIIESWLKAHVRNHKKIGNTVMLKDSC